MTAILSCICCEKKITLNKSDNHLIDMENRNDYDKLI